MLHCGYSNSCRMNKKTVKKLQPPTELVLCTLSVREDMAVVFMTNIFMSANAYKRKSVIIQLLL